MIRNCHYNSNPFVKTNLSLRQLSPRNYLKSHPLYHMQTVVIPSFLIKQSQPLFLLSYSQNRLLSYRFLCIDFFIIQSYSSLYSFHVQKNHTTKFYHFHGYFTRFKLHFFVQFGTIVLQNSYYSQLICTKHTDTFLQA